MHASEIIYYAPEAETSHCNAFFDGVYLYSRIEGLSSLNGADGKKRKIRGFLRRIGKGAKKAGKKAFRIIKKAIPVAATVASFVPGIGTGIAAALSVADMALKGNKRKKAREQAGQMQTANNIGHGPQTGPLPQNRAHAPGLPPSATIALANGARKKIKPNLVVEVAKSLSPDIGLLARLARAEARSHNHATGKDVREMTKAKMKAIHSRAAHY